MIEFENLVLNWIQSRHVMDIAQENWPHEIHVSFHMSQMINPMDRRFQWLYSGGFEPYLDFFQVYSDALLQMKKSIQFLCGLYNFCKSCLTSPQVLWKS